MFSWLRRHIKAGSRAQKDAAAFNSTERCVVVDVETSGLIVHEDRLLAIGAVAVHGDRVVIADSFETLVRSEAPSERDNILVHGIGMEAQVSAVPQAEAVTAFLEYVADAPLVAFHASFDQAFLTRATKDRLGIHMNNAWLDLAQLAPALLPDVKAKALDEWLLYFGIPVDRRHNAASDALATAMLLLRLRALAPPMERNVDSLVRLANAGRWLGAR